MNYKIKVGIVGYGNLRRGVQLAIGEIDILPAYLSPRSASDLRKDLL